jgi:hypothetical protein
MNSVNAKNEKVVAISQSMYFPWPGLFDLIRLSNVFVHYDDVQLSRGFYNRVQLKNATGSFLISVPLEDRRQKQLINKSVIHYGTAWVREHRRSLEFNYKGAAFLDEALKLFDEVHSECFEYLNQLTQRSVRLAASFLKLDDRTSFLDSVDLGVRGNGSQRLLDITKKLGGTIYLTGHGALNYLDHDLFERNGVEVRYMRYKFQQYSQQLGSFTPFVSVLDAVAHLGLESSKILQSETVNWRKAIERPYELQPDVV